MRKVSTILLACLTISIMLAIPRMGFADTCVVPNNCMYDNDEIAVRPSAGYAWFAHNLWTLKGVSQPIALWGAAGDIPLTADVDGDSFQDIISYRPSVGVWFVLQSSFAYSTQNPRIIQWGASGDIPLVPVIATISTDLIVWRPSNGYWFILTYSSNYDPTKATIIQWGASGDVPHTGDFDGDGVYDLAVWRPSSGTWFVLLSSKAYSPANAMIKKWGKGNLGDISFVVDTDEDGKDDFVIWRPSSGTWFMLQSKANYDPAYPRIVQWGISTDQPLVHPHIFHANVPPAVIVWRPSAGTWFFLYGPNFDPTSDTIIVNWGTAGDIVFMTDTSNYRGS